MKKCVGGEQTLENLGFRDDKNKKMQTIREFISQRNWRVPTLTTILFIEDVIKKYSGETQNKIYNRVKKKVMYGVFMIAIKYLEEINKIIIERDKKKIITYIWNPDLVKKYRNNPELEWKPKK